VVKIKFLTYTARRADCLIDFENAKILRL